MPHAESYCVVPCSIVSDPLTLPTRQTTIVIRQSSVLFHLDTLHSYNDRLHPFWFCSPPLKQLKVDIYSKFKLRSVQYRGNDVLQPVLSNSKMLCTTVKLLPSANMYIQHVFYTGSIVFYKGQNSDTTDTRCEQ